ncbi:LA_2272 family surface repeat-containing protein [Flavobacterium beibuense]|uniref:LA_2272 family surface repeat-containing protein n=1 Tax=Flavobacterium beibuense TaxID=657326 RepID=UPI003A8F34B3
MKIRLFVLLLLLCYVKSVAQQEYKTQIFSFAPISANVKTVNGMVLGVWHYDYDLEMPKHINGLNIEINPVSPLLLLYIDPQKRIDISREVRLVQNGLHLSIGGFLGNVKQNGMGVSLYNITCASNGLTLTAFYNYSLEMNGLHIAGLKNDTQKGSGLQIAIFNNAGVQFHGVQLGLLNNSEVLHGLQIGLFNKTTHTKGLQFGFWNINAKRSLPLINW